MAEFFLSVPFRNCRYPKHPAVRKETFVYLPHKTTAMENKKLGMASDHAGYDMKRFLAEALTREGYEITDYGCDNDISCDYPDYAHPLACAIERGEVPLGIALCGSGNGVSITLNKHQGIRAALCWNEELGSLARRHNDANVCSLPARFIDDETALRIVHAYLSSSFEGGRHERRVEKIPVTHSC